MDLSLVDNSAMYKLAAQLAIILLIMFLVGFAFASILKLLKAPKWLYNFSITIGVLLGLYLGFLILGL